MLGGFVDSMVECCGLQRCVGSFGLSQVAEGFGVGGERSPFGLRTQLRSLRGNTSGELVPRDDVKIVPPLIVDLAAWSKPGA